MDYASSLAYLFPRTAQMKFGLDTTRSLLEAIGNPQHQFASIHVAGTNGKGSTCALIAAALEARGAKVGLYTSPHLVSFRERIRVNGEMIPEMAVASWTTALQPEIESLGATFFEATTAMAFAHFAAMNVDVAVVEVGLGGRLDSTNVITPLVSVVTHVALDHQKYLGDTIEQIAREKAGIAKPGVPFVIGEADPAVVQVLLDAIGAGGSVAGSPINRRPGNSLAPLAQTSGPRLTDPANLAASPHVIVPKDEAYTGPLALAGPHQRRNAAVAVAALEALPAGLRPTTDQVADAFAQVRMPGRIDRRGRWLFDVAHNPDGIKALAAALEELDLPRPLHALVSILGDKAWAEMLVELDRVIDVGILTHAPTALERRWEPEWLEQWLADPSRPPAQAQWRLVPDFEQALADVERGAGTVLVTGSFHTVGDVLVARGLELP